MKRKVLSIFILSANLLNLTAQNMTNSPASMFGLGELSTGEGGLYSGMGELVSHCGEKMLIIVRTRLL